MLSAAGLVLLLTDGDSDDPVGVTVRVSGGVPLNGTIKVDEDLQASELDSISAPISPVYAIHDPDGQAGPFTLSFAIPPELSAKERRRLAVATRADGDNGWILLSGRVKAGRFLVVTNHLSWWQLRLPKIEFKLPSRESIERSIGVRARPPECTSRPSGLRLDVDDPSGILVSPCLDQDGARTVLKINNNRAVGVELDLPAGAAVIDTTSRTLGEAAWRQIYKLALPDDQRMLPGAGSVSIALDELPAELRLRATNSAFVLDALIDLTAANRGGKAEALTPTFLEGVKCLHTASQQVPDSWRSPIELLDSLRDVVGDCIELLVPEARAAARLTLGLAKLAYALWDSVRVVVDSTATVTVSALPIKLLPAVLPADRTYAKDTGRPGTSCGVVDEVFPRTGYAVSTQVVVDLGSLSCLEAREIVRDYIGADNPCVNAGNTCVLDLRGWRCAAPTAGSFPRIVSCSRIGAGRQHVLGLDAPSTLPRGSLTDCGTEPETEIPGPFDVRANIVCPAAQSIARAALGSDGCREREGKCISMGFLCSTEHEVDYVYESKCTLGHSAVRFEQGD